MLGHLMRKGIHVKRVKSEDPTGEGSSRSRKVRKLDFKKMNLYSTCRVCLKQGSIPIFGHDKSDNISKGLYTFGGIEVRINDPYPKFLCQPCNELLQGAILFRKTAQQSDGLLKQPIENDSDTDLLLDCVEIKCEHEEKTCVDIHNGLAEENVKTQIINIEIIKSECTEEEMKTQKINIEDLKSECKEIKVKTQKINIVDLKSECKEKKLKAQKINIEDFKSECKEKKVTTQKINIADLKSECKEKKLKTQKINIKDKNSGKKKKVKTQRTYYCRRCKISFETSKDLNEHKMSEEHEKMRQICPICHKLYTAEYFKYHMAVHKDKAPYLCDVCGKNFGFRATLATHRLIHSNELPYKCSQCPYRGRGKEALKMHMRSHTGERPYQCTNCPSKFISSSNLSKHMRTHTEQNNFRCDTCGKGFYSKREMEVHVNAHHMGIKDHVCDDCGKAFGSRRQMMKHQLKVHKRKKLRPGKMPLYLKVEMTNQQKQDTSVET